MKRAERMVFAARAMIGAPFRLHGRNPPTGLDCIGLALRVLEQAGHKRLGGGMIPAAYSVRGGTAEQFGKTMRAAGLRAVRRAKAGDLVLAQAGVAQFHLMIRTDAGHVHADASLGKVAEMPGASPWPVIAYFRWGR
ncbi:MAG: peptidoglycan endopeptidase [Sphingobium sp.]|nr:peptidoglycan endopeptidase [Sphingobium sp.]MBP6112954.1 peptidoglycan endopeptidase [Sphingobium sp.]MBP8672128.1 peptidoglycan endopeptidase [Sphingobium sp.]MBP9158702.1 peptidoglycan endopeptidase [Sphingobium sp.]MCC6482824.1 peptidoglycan endopeptidase [Sphingomonadaceae bacterium]